MGYIRILIVFLASFTTPGLGYLLIGKTKRFVLLYCLCFLLTLPCYIAVRLLAEYFPSSLAPSLGLVMLGSFFLFAIGIVFLVRLMSQIFYRTQAFRWKHGVAAFLIAIANLVVSSWSETYTKTHLFRGLTLSKGTGLAPVLLEGEKVLLVQPLHGLHKGQIVLVRNPEKQDHLLFLFVAGLEGDTYITASGEQTIAKDFVLFSYGLDSEKYFGPVSLDQVEGVAFQIYWSQDSSGKIRWDRIFTVL